MQFEICLNREIYNRFYIKRTFLLNLEFNIVQGFDQNKSYNQY